MIVSDLYIYPYKSGPAVRVESAVAQARGFSNDRRFMVTNPQGGFISQRTHPKLGHASATFDGELFTLSAPGLGDLVLEPGGGTRVDVQVWSDSLPADRCSSAIEDWFSELIGGHTWVVAMPEDSTRPSDGFPETPLSFADGFPYLIATEASRVDLNARISGDEVPMLAFRPNIVVRGADAWAEDAWDRVKIGDAVFQCTTNCERCRIVTLDPALPGSPRRDGEPLRTLTKFRRNARGKVDFARNAIAETLGAVSIGDALELM